MTILEKYQKIRAEIRYNFLDISSLEDMLEEEGEFDLAENVSDFLADLEYSIDILYCKMLERFDECYK